MLSIKEQDIKTGGFKLVPYLSQHFEEWVNTKHEDSDQIFPDITGPSRENVDISPVDLLIFNSLLANGTRPYHSEIGCESHDIFPCTLLIRMMRQNV